MNEVNIGQNTALVAVFSPTFFDSSENWHNESLKHKTDTKNLCLGALERLNIEQNSKNKKKPTTTIFFKKILVSMT
jgi:hypothetical protein